MVVAYGRGEVLIIKTESWSCLVVLVQAVVSYFWAWLLFIIPPVSVVKVRKDIAIVVGFMGC